tara:strand:- start:216 stop:956 length:741 start_codon:yes stop_codon:yes gene_type:complete
MKKHIAVLFSGFVRNWKETYTNFLKNVIDNNKHHYTFDCYAVTYTVTDRYDKPADFKEYLSDFEIQQIKNIYKFKKINFIDYKETFIKMSQQTDSLLKIQQYTGAKYKIETIFSQSYCVKKTFDLLQGSYDFILRTRFDSNFLNPVNIPEIEKQEIGTLSFKSNQNFMDHVVFGNYENMSVFCKSYENLKNIDFLTKHKIKFIEDLFRETICENKIQNTTLPWKVSVKRRDRTLLLWDIEKFGDNI